MKITGLIFLCGSLLLIGCNKGSTTGTTTGTTSGGVSTKADKVKQTDVVVGKGSLVVADGDTIWVQYRGTLTNGKEFDVNMSTDKDPLTFMIGQGAVIRGWDEGLLGMKVGGERKLFVPASLAYGANGKGTVPPNADLNFDVKMLGIQKAGQEKVIDCEDLSPGTGDRVAKDGDTVTLQYVGTLLNGKVFDDSHKAKKPYSFTIGKGLALPCIDEGVKGMKVGGKRKITSPPAVAFGAKPGTAVPAGSEVVFNVELVSLK